MPDMTERQPDNSYRSNPANSDIESQTLLPRYSGYSSILPPAPGEGLPTKPKSSRWKCMLAILAILIPMGYLFMVYIPEASIYTPVPDLVRVKDLNHPQFHKGSRLVIVGDVHGSYKELRKLLNTVKFKQHKDHLLLLGDFITKGTHSIEVLEYAAKINASCVRGNHENEIISMYADYHNLPSPKTELPNTHSGHIDLPSTPAVKKQFRNIVGGISRQSFDQTDDRQLVKHLTPKHIKFLGKCPAILSLGPISETGLNSYGVHGGLAWNIDDLEFQDPAMVMSMRSMLPPKYTEWSEEDEGEPWSELWNKHQLTLKKKDRRVVFYGHDARSGLNLKEYTKGLDSGCVKGNRMSAYVVSRSKHGAFDHEFVSIDCETQSANFDNQNA